MQFDHNVPKNWMSQQLDHMPQWSQLGTRLLILPHAQPLMDLYQYAKSHMPVETPYIHGMPLYSSLYNIPYSGGFSDFGFTQPQSTQGQGNEGFYSSMHYQPQQVVPSQKSAYEPLFPDDNPFVVDNEGNKTNLPDQFYKLPDGRYVNAAALAYEQVAAGRKKNGFYR